MRRSSFIGSALTGAVTLAAPAIRPSHLTGIARIAGTSLAQTAEAILPPGRLALLSGVILWLIDSDGASLSAARSVVSGTGGWLQDPAWSPDGERVAYAHVRFPLGSQGTAPGGFPWPSAE